METQLKRGRVLFIIQAALEYLVSILVTGQFLTTLTKELGLSDSLTGILSSIISLGCLFQLISMVFRKKTVKSFVVLLSILNQVLFLFLFPAAHPSFCCCASISCAPKTLPLWLATMPVRSPGKSATHSFPGSIDPRLRRNPL